MRALIVDVWAHDDRVVELEGHWVRFVNPKRFLSGAPYDGFVSTQGFEDLRQKGERRLMALLAHIEELVSIEQADAIFVNQPLLPPRWVVDRMRGVKRFLACFDDPFKTFATTVPCLWAFDGAYYCSPSFDGSVSFPEMLERFGTKNHHWFPQSSTDPTPELVRRVESSWSSRSPHLIYVGKCYGPKVDRLAALHASRLPIRVFGRDWPLNGLAGYLGPLRGRRYFPIRVKPLSEVQRTEAYLSALVGFNMHLGDNAETGNARMYETCMHGAMLLSDVAGQGKHRGIFEPGVEAAFYSTTEEAIELAKRFLREPLAAIRIAKRGYARAVSEYAPDKCLQRLLAWGESCTTSGVRG